MPADRSTRTEKSPLKLLLWTAIAGLIVGLLGLGELPEDFLRATRNSTHVHEASGDIVFVAIDEKSIAHVGQFPWPRRYHAKLIDRLTAAGAEHIFLDIVFEAPSTRPDDEALAQSINRSNRVVLAMKGRSGLQGGDKTDPLPLPPVLAASSAGTASIGVAYNYQNAAWRLPYSAPTKNGSIPSFAALMSGRPVEKAGRFVPDYSIDPYTVPSISASDVLEGTSSEPLHGKTVVIGIATDGSGDQYFLPGWGRLPGAYLHIIGAETLRNGTPVYLAWVPAFLIALAIAALVVLRQLRGGAAILSLAAAAIVALATTLEGYLITLDVMPALVVCTIIIATLAWRRWREGGLVDSVSGLPNLAALKLSRDGRAKTLIVARIINYTEIAASLPAEKEKVLVEQVVSRLRVGSDERQLFHGDDGIFAWFEESRLPLSNHLEALYALFRNPARIDGLAIDLSVSFGVEIGSSRSLSNRLASALVAAEEAAHDGLKWKYYDPEALQDASWKLSMLSQLDSAVDKGEVWVAFQPKLDLKTRRLVGAEALARWTHPQKGPIAASEFIAAAEQNDRIGKLTDFVLDEAIRAGAAANEKQSDFGMAVNLSARLLTDQGFTLRLEAMLARHQLPARLLTLELTETAELAGSGKAIDMLGAIRDLGVNISIDDYGTGLSTLDYLKKIPASEIKIDQSFVRSIVDNRSDMVMVQSTIALAHSLGRKVVAEGVEQQSVLDLLAEMNCDIAQGFIIGRPMSIDSLLRRLVQRRGSRVA